MIRPVIALLFLCLPSLFFAQTVGDALRYSTFQPGVTARALGVGGSLGALGGDYSTVATNPAGMAWFRSSQFQLSPGIYSLGTEAELVTGGINFPNKENVTSLTLGSLGLVIHSRPKRQSDWRTFNFGIGFHRTASFRREFFYEGKSPGSITDRFVELANGLTPAELEQVDPFEAFPAFQTFAIDTFGGPRNYINDFADNPSVVRSQSVTERGSITEMALSFGANYQEKLMIGATVGFPILNYEQRSSYNEVDVDSIPVFDELNFNERLETRGIGVNIRLGIIYRASQLLRVGLAFHSPSWISLDDDYSTDMAFVNDVNFERLEWESPIGEFSYNLATPWRVIGSVGMVFGKNGFLTGEVEYLDYGGANFNFTKEDPQFQSDESFVNRQISDQLGSAIRVRIGGEAAYEIFRFRAGLGLQQSPFEGDNSLNESLHFGLGVHEGSFFLDLGYRHLNIKDGFVPYTLTNEGRQQQVDLNSNQSEFLLTVGFRF